MTNVPWCPGCDPGIEKGHLNTLRTLVNNDVGECGIVKRGITETFFIFKKSILSAG